MLRILAHTGRFVLFALLGLGLLLAAVLGVAQTGPGQRLIASGLSRLLSSEAAPVTVAGLHGLLPVVVELERVTLADQAGVWLAVEDAKLAWSPSALLRGRLQIDGVRAGRVRLERLPPSAPAAEPSEPFRLPELPDYLPLITLERLAIDRLELAQPVLGQAASFAADGRIAANPDGQSLALDLALRRVDQPTAQASLQATLGLRPASLALNLTAKEQGGLIAGIAGRPEVTGLDLSLAGAGPLTAWSGRLTAAAPGLARTELDLTLQAEAQPRLAIRGGVWPAAGLLPQGTGPLLGERLDLALAAVQTGSQQLSVEQLELTAAGGQLRGQGELDLDAQTFALDAAASLPDLALASDLAGQKLAGSAQLNATAAGPLAQPKGQLTLAADGLQQGELSLQQLAATLDWQALARLDRADAALRLAAQGRLDGLDLAGTPLPERALAFNLQAVAPKSGPIDLSQLQLTGEHLQLTGSGQLDPAKLAGAAKLALAAPDLAPLATRYGQTLTGAATLQADLALAPAAEALDVTLHGALQDLAGLPPGASQLVGGQASLSARARLRPDQRLELTDLGVTTGHAELAASGRLGLDAAQALAGTVSLTLPDLAVLADLSPGLAGKLTAEATLAGSANAPTIALNATGTELTATGVRLDRATLAADASELADAPAGQLTLNLAARKSEAELGTRYRLAGQRLQLQDLGLRLPGGRLAGQLDLDLATLLADGKLGGRIERLTALSPFLALPLQGAADLDLQLRSAAGRQDGQASLALAGFESPFGRARSLRAEAKLADLLARPQVDARVAGIGLGQGAAIVNRLDATAKGDLERLAVQASLVGQAGQPLNLETDLALSLGPTTKVAVEHLAGRFAGLPLQLAAPLTVTAAGQALELAGLDLRLGEARLAGAAKLGERDLTGQLQLNGVPLAWSERFGGPALAGTGRAQLTLAGRATAPEATLSVALDGLQPAGSAATVPPGRLTLDASLASRRLDLALALRGMAERPVSARLAAPLDWSLRPFAVSLPPDGELAGRVAGELELARLVDLLGLDRQRLAGRLVTNLTIAGTAAAPAVSGPINLIGGHYENYASGSVLSALELRAALSPRALTLTRLTGQVGEQGSLSGNGSITLDPAAGWPTVLNLTLDQAPVVQRDDIKATLGGQIGVTGNLRSALVRGQLKVDQAEIGIPEGGGPDVPVLDVQVAGAKAPPPPDPSAPAIDPRFDLKLDLPERVYVRGRGLDSEWQGQLALTGSVSEPLIAGELAVKRGYFDFLDKRFTLEEGTIELDGSSPPNPLLSLKATADAEDFTAIVWLKGPATDPELTLESEPVLPQDEVLSRLLFNRQISEISPTQAASLALALNRLRGGGGFDLFSELRDRLAIDTLDIVSGDTTTDSRLRAGKYLSDDVYLEVERGTAASSGKARVEVEILPDVAVEAETSENGTGGVGVKWKYDY